MQRIPVLIAVSLLVANCAPRPPIAASPASGDGFGGDPRWASGHYTFNFSDTDESANVDVKFRRNAEPYALCEWLADGTMEDVIRERKVTFTGAFAVVEKDGSVLVDGEFVSFKITGKRLDWLPGYSNQSLYKE